MKRNREIVRRWVIEIEIEWWWWICKSVKEKENRIWLREIILSREKRVLLRVDWKKKKELEWEWEKEK